MQDFLSFYQFGGFFNHIVTLFALAALSAVVIHAVTKPSPQQSLQLLALADRLSGLGIIAGALGVIFGLADMGSVLAMVKAEQVLQVIGEGLAIVGIPLTWALMCAIPIRLATAVYSQRAVAM